MRWFDRVCRAVFWCEAVLNLFSGGLALLFPVLFLAAFSSQPGAPVTWLFTQGYGVLLLELALVEGGALLSKRDAILRYTFLCLLAGDLLQIALFVQFGLASQHWPGAVLFALSVTVLLICVRIAWLHQFEHRRALIKSLLPASVERSTL